MTSKTLALAVAVILMFGCESSESPDEGPSEQNAPITVEGIERNSEFGVGLDNPFFVDIHKSQEARILEKRPAFAEAKERLEQVLPEFEYDVVRVGSDWFAFTRVDDFNQNPEPRILESYIWQRGALVEVLVPSSGLIYVHKWAMVPDNYSGFDVNQAKLRSQKILELDVDFRQIRNLIYWNREVAPALKSGIIKGNST